MFKLSHIFRLTPKNHYLRVSDHQELPAVPVHETTISRNCRCHTTTKPQETTYVLVVVAQRPNYEKQHPPSPQEQHAPPPVTRTAVAALATSENPNTQPPPNRKKKIKHFQIGKLTAPDSSKSENPNPSSNVRRIRAAHGHTINRYIRLLKEKRCNFQETCGHAGNLGHIINMSFHFLTVKKSDPELEHGGYVICVTL